MTCFTAPSLAGPKALTRPSSRTAIELTAARHRLRRGTGTRRAERRASLAAASGSAAAPGAAGTRPPPPTPASVPPARRRPMPARTPPGTSTTAHCTAATLPAAQAQ